MRNQYHAWLLFASLVGLAWACVDPHRSIQSTNKQDTALALSTDTANDTQSDAAGIDDAMVDADNPATDAGTVADTGTSVDTGAIADTGAAADTGASADTNTSADTGASADTGTSIDAGAVADTGNTADAGSQSDASLGTDTAAAADTNSAADSGSSDTQGADASTADAGPKCDHPMTCPGAALPAWKAEQVHPKAKDPKKVYGLDTFKGTPTFVALLAAW